MGDASSLLGVTQMHMSYSPCIAWPASSQVTAGKVCLPPVCRTIYIFLVWFLTLRTETLSVSMLAEATLEWEGMGMIPELTYGLLPTSSSVHVYLGIRIGGGRALQSR